MKKRITKGFTLVEIMIVVAIIGLLVAIALPNFMKARRKSVIRSAQASLKQLEGAIEQAKLDGITITYDAGGAFNGSLSNAILPDYLKAVPECPAGGSWYITNNYVAATITDYNGGNNFTAYDTVTP